jgi:hypothetical protein
MTDKDKEKKSVITINSISAADVDYFQIPTGLSGDIKYTKIPMTDILLPASSNVASSLFGIPSSPQQQELQKEINNLRKQGMEQANTIQALKKDNKDQAKEVKEYKETLEKIRTKDSLNHLLYKVNEDAGKMLFQSNDFGQLFTGTNECNAFVMSIDIRRSTELMLKAKDADLYAEFVTGLCIKLEEIILNNYGVFDKFTGDGILAFFPDFYSGKDSGYLTIKSAVECHQFFESYYKLQRQCFTSILTDVGLGIGIDFGETRFVRIGRDLTIVGIPVVYACRMSDAKAGQTLLNQGAFDEIFPKYQQCCQYQETALVTKNEGKILAYEISLIDEKKNITKPNWDELVDEFKSRL